MCKEKGNMLQQSDECSRKAEQKITKGQQDPGGEKQQDLKSLRKSPETTRADSLLLIILVSKLKEHVGLLSVEE